MKKLMGLVVALSLGACTYAVGGVSADGHVVMAKNVGVLFGILNKVYVCNVTPGGLTGCTAGETP